MNKKLIFFLALLTTVFTSVNAQEKMKPEDTEFYTPVPQVVIPGKSCGDAPSDATILFDGKNLDQWVLANDTTKPADWIVHNGVVTVKKSSGNIQTKQSFTDYQLHLEWREPKDIEGSGQARGNSGLFLASIGKGDAGYEMQILDNYNNKTYTNGQAGSIYKQSPPLVNPNRPPGEWQYYDVIWTAPRFNEDGSLKSPARVTAFFNGVLVQNNFELKGPTLYIGHPTYEGAANGASPIKLQAHGDKSKPISFRNIWVRPIENNKQPGAQ
ncbi:MAG: 3-keto-disaccharide hydrolase [Ginsengibacter sp.]